jgi:hypothetical protein
MKQSKLLLVTTATIIGLLLVASFSWSLKPTAHAQTNNADWQLSVTGLVENPMNFTLADLEAMPQTTEHATLYCVDDPGVAVLEGNWTGVQLWTLLEAAGGVSPGAIKVAFYASDDFTTDLPIATAQQDNVVLAYEENGNPLPNVLRLVVPGEWGYKWIDMVTNIQLVNYNFLGTEESQGYDDNGVAAFPLPPEAAMPSSPSSPVSTPSLSPSPKPSFSATPSPSSSPSSTSVTSTMKSKQTPPTINSTFISVIAVLIVTIAAAAILRKSKQNKSKSKRYP